MDKLRRYLVAGGVLIVAGVGLVAYSTTGLPFAIAESFGILGAVAIGLGLVMVISALWIDLSQLNRERSRASQPTSSFS